MSRFTEELLVSPLSDGRTWVIRRDFGYDIGEEDSGNTIDVPIGFKTDFASIPRIFWIFIPRWGKYGNAAVIHDYLYWDQGYSRKESDSIFLEAMNVLEVPNITRKCIYYMVRLFGGIAWKSNRKKMVESPHLKIHENMATTQYIKTEQTHDV
jgi:hypothetical protein